MRITDLRVARGSNGMLAENRDCHRVAARGRAGKALNLRLGNWSRIAVPCLLTNSLFTPDLAICLPMEAAERFTSVGPFRVHRGRHMYRC